MSPTHIFEDGYAYFVTTVTNGRQPIFSHPDNADLFLNVLTYHKYSLDFALYGFVIMPDHLHLIIRPYGNHDLSYIMKG